MWRCRFWNFMKVSGIKKKARLDTGRISRGMICFQNRYFKMGVRKGISKHRFIKGNIQLFFCINWWFAIRRTIDFHSRKRKQIKSQSCMWFVIGVCWLVFADADISSTVSQTGQWTYLFGKSLWVCRWQCFHNQNHLSIVYRLDDYRNCENTNGLFQIWKGQKKRLHSSL